MTASTFSSLTSGLNRKSTTQLLESICGLVVVACVISLKLISFVYFFSGSGLDSELGPMGTRPPGPLGGDDER
jgi:hypothetical protein